MNSRERVLAAAERWRPDRPATSLRCTPEVWSALQAYFGVRTNDEVLDELDIDWRGIYVTHLPFIGPQERSAIPLGSEGTDYWGCNIRKAENRFNIYFEFYDFPLAHCRTVADVDAHDWPDVDWWDYSAVPRLIQEATQKDRRAIMFFAGGAFETPWYMRGFEQFMMDLYLNPEIVQAICQHVLEYCRQVTERVLAEARGQIDIIGSGGDVGGQEGMIVSPAVWREQIKPFSAQLITPYKAMGLKTFYHSCGSIRPIIPDLIEVGLDILEPIQVSAAGMTPEEIFPAYGDRLSFNGGIDEVHLLPHATPDEVYRETTRVIDVLGKNGGYIVSPSHQVQGDTPAENVVALFQAAHDYRWRDV